jgi:hypothetical protein
VRKIALLLLLVLSLPAVADIGHDVTIPIVGVLTQPDVTYRTELVIRNHRDVGQTVVFEFIGEHLGGPYPYDGVLYLEPRQTIFEPQGRVPGGRDRIFAMRMWTAKQTGGGIFEPDPEGQIEAMAYIVRDRGRFAYLGSSRQEMPATASSEYYAPEATFFGIRHDGIAYTNVGITNMHTEPMTFIVEFPYIAPFEVEVPARTLSQFRLPGAGNAGRQVKVTPAWAKNGTTPAPWVAFASTVDPQTGDAYTGIRSLATANYKGN